MSALELSSEGKELMRDFGLSYAELKAINKELLDAAKKFVYYASNGKHPGWAKYLDTVSGAKLVAAIARAEGRA